MSSAHPGPPSPTTTPASPPDILAVKWGYNPNSSSLGVDVTFLLFGMSAITLMTPVVAWWLRARAKAATPAPPDSDGSSPTAAT